jgi:NAD(P) transhydrogenase subunit alpha
VVITTAAVPGKKAPVLITGDMVERMAPGSVIVDLAIERGGNCELTEADRIVQKHGVTIAGPTNLASSAPYHASQMYAKNISSFLLHIAKGGTINFDADDEILRETLLTRDGEVVNRRIRELLGMTGKES